MKLSDLTLSSMCLALLIVCSKITIQIGPIPLTLQTFCVILIGYILKFKKALFLFIAYIIAGLIGIPIFSTGGGPQYVFQPSFGFIIGFACSSFLTGISVTRKKPVLYLQGLFGLLLLDFIGLIYMYFILNYYYEYNKSISYVLSVGFFPFLLKDIVSVFLSTFIYLRLEPYLPNSLYKYKNKISSHV